MKIRVSWVKATLQTPLLYQPSYYLHFKTGEAVLSVFKIQIAFSLLRLLMTLSGIATHVSFDKQRLATSLLLHCAHPYQFTFWFTVKSSPPWWGLSTKGLVWIDPFRMLKLKCHQFFVRFPFQGRELLLCAWFDLHWNRSPRLGCCHWHVLPLDRWKVLIWLTEFYSVNRPTSRIHNLSSSVTRNPKHLFHLNFPLEDPEVPQTSRVYFSETKETASRTWVAKIRMPTSQLSQWEPNYKVIIYDKHKHFFVNPILLRHILIN